jgi:endoglucanase
MMTARTRTSILTLSALAWLVATAGPALAGGPRPGPAALRGGVPTISGIPRQGDTLVTDPGQWSRRPTSYAYQWQACSVSGCSAIAGADRSIYTLRSSDVGRRVDVRVTAAAAGARATARSRRTAAVGAASAGSETPLTGLRVSGDELVAGNGSVVHLHGVNDSGTEYACIQGWGIFNGPSTAASVAAMAGWHINMVRIPLNEDCWLGINGVNPAYSGQKYISAIVNYVNLLHQYGIYAELSLMWGAPGTAQATYQPNAPDEDHSPAMWAGMAATFKDDPNVILAPWGETSVDWSCFKSGCRNQATFATGAWDGDGTCGSDCYYYASAGMQQAVNVMRQAGYNGPLSIPCIEYANMCGQLPNGSDYDGSTWLASKPSDPDGQLIAEAHVYGLNACDTTACFDSSMLPIRKAGYPLIWGETGETYNYSDCPSTAYIKTFLTWAEGNDVGTLAWVWDTWGACNTGALISDANGTPEGAFGAYVEHNYQTTFPANP